MRKRLVLAGLGVMAILVGVAAFAAYTAQWVNITARVEKEITVACVDDSVSPPVVTDCDFGVVFPQNTEEKVVEVALSNSFYNQTQKSNVEFWALWECKLVDETQPPSATNPCREDIVDPDYTYDTVHGKWVHSNPLKLDGNIRDYITVNAASGCFDPSTFVAPTLNPAKLEGIADGVIDRSVTPKCLYHLRFQPPACTGSYNPLTDPLPLSTVVDCNAVKTDPDPQKWDEWVNLGDNFKIQVYHHSID
jgi:hypothetical protein